MYVDFECPECSAQFRLGESELLTVSTVACPGCKKKVPSKLIKDIENFIIYSSKSEFSVRFSHAPTININSFSTGMLVYAKQRLKDKVAVESWDDLDTVLQGEDKRNAVMGMIEGALIMYHTQVQKNLKQFGLDMGELY